MGKARIKPRIDLLEKDQEDVTWFANRQNQIFLKELRPRVASEHARKKMSTKA